MIEWIPFICMGLLRPKKAAERTDFVASYWPLQRAVRRFLIIKSPVTVLRARRTRKRLQDIGLKQCAMRTMAVT